MGLPAVEGEESPQKTTATYQTRTWLSGPPSPVRLRRTTPEMREKAAASQKSVAKSIATPLPGGQPNYYGPEPNYANSPLTVVKSTSERKIKSIAGIKKFVDSLPGLGIANKNNLGQYIPVAVPDTKKYPGSDYYEIGLVQYKKQMHSDLSKTRLRGYVQVNGPNTNTSPISAAQYAGPLIIAQSNRPVRLKFSNLLPTGAAGNLFIPVDTSIMGAGMGPNGTSEMYTQNRAVIHLHGGVTPWISDGTPHQWITPAGESTSYKQGVSVTPVPDMLPLPVEGDGTATLFYTNQQSSRMMFYHDHTYGLTRLNVYAGEVAGYLLTDPTEENLINKKIIPSLPGDYRYGIPLIIQDKTFVPPQQQLNMQDPTWNYRRKVGSLWFPHVYMPNQNPSSPSGVNPMGRWDYGPWFWPPFNSGAGLIHGPILDPNGSGLEVPGTPNPSIVPEAFMDTPIVNGTAYPYLEVDRKAYRFRILNGSNDRFWNLQLYYADPLTVSIIDGGSGYTKAPKVKFKGGNHVSKGDFKPAKGKAIINNGSVTGIKITDPGSGYVSAPQIVFSGGGKHVTKAIAVASIFTDVKMIPASPTEHVPPYYPTMDGRAGGVPDPTMAGPSMIQIGTEGGFLPGPVVLPNTPIGYQYNRRDITVLNVLEKTLFLGPAERADVIIDFSQVPKNVSTIILYNDAPAPVPGFDPRNDYYTNNPDQTSTGGAPSTIAGYGPNTRTIMQFRLSNKKSKKPFNLKALQKALPAAYTASQPAPVVPETTYPAPYKANQDVYSRIQDTSLQFTPLMASSAITVPMQPKSIIESFELNYGRMNAVLGTEMVFTNDGNQTSVPLNFIDPPTEFLADNTIQIWKITHNGVDTHAVHTHLFNMQLINRVGWDGAIRPPDPNELGWKDTIRMNPLEDIIVAMRPVKPVVPFAIPNSIRPLSPSMPASSSFTSFDPVTGGAVTWSNAQNHNFGLEYIWHCHLLGHEENDMMRPVVFNTVPTAPVAHGTLSGSTVTITIDQPPTPGPGVIDHYDVTVTIPGPTPDSGTVYTIVPPATSVDIPVTATGQYIFTIQAVYANGTSMPVVVSVTV
jgi:FtsP/CotA-like multicopper oxidase with cupredoxin domain